MTFLISLAAAIIASAVRIAMPQSKKYLTGFLALMFWGATLMWTVDGIVGLIEEGAFIELSDTAVMADDALLGATVLVGGVIIWGIANIVSRQRAAKTA
jgi:hypothetical protein